MCLEASCGCNVEIFEPRISGGVGGGDEGRCFEFGTDIDDDSSSTAFKIDITSSLGVRDFLAFFVAGVLEVAGLDEEGGEFGRNGWNQAGEFRLGDSPCIEFCLKGDGCRLVVGGEKARGGEVALEGDITLGGGDIARGGGDNALLLSGGRGGFLEIVSWISNPIPGCDACLFSSIVPCIL